jgi:hypothetical protein
VRKELISELRRVAKWYSLSYPATSKLLREAADELDAARKLLETPRASRAWSEARYAWLDGALAIPDNVPGIPVTNETTVHLSTDEDEDDDIKGR